MHARHFHHGKENWALELTVRCDTLSSTSFSRIRKHILSEPPPAKIGITSSVICGAKIISIPAEKKAPAMVTAFRSGLMKMERATNQKNMKRLLATRATEDV